MVRNETTIVAEGTLPYFIHTKSKEGKLCCIGIPHSFMVKLLVTSKELKSIRVHFVPCIFLIARDFVSHFYKTEIAISVPFFSFCRESVGALTQNLAVLPRQVLHHKNV